MREDTQAQSCPFCSGVNDALPAVRQVWIQPDMHRRAVAALLAARRRDVSLVDYTSFELMRQTGIYTVFTFNRHFAE